MKKKTMVAGLTGLMVLSGALAGCSSEDANAKEGKVTVKLAHFSDPNEVKIVNEQVKKFEAANPNIDVVAEPITGDFFEVLKTRMASNNEPDVFYMDIFQTDAFLDADRLLALNEYISEEEMSDFQPNLVQAFTGEDDSLYGVPKDYNTLVLYYNKKMLEEAGVDVPKTWDELKAAAKTLTKGNVVGMSLQNELPRFQPFLYSNGGSMMQDGKPKVNTKENIEALEFWMSLYKDGVAETPVDLGVGWNGDAFAQEKVAMTVEGGWMIQALKEQAPDLEYGMVELPVKKDPASMMFTVAYSASKNTKHPKEAAELIKFLTNEESQQLTTDEGRSIPSRISMANDFLTTYPERQALVDAVEHASEFNYGVVSGVVVSEVAKSAEKILLGQSSVQKALDEAQKQIDAALARQK